MLCRSSTRRGSTDAGDGPTSSRWRPIGLGLAVTLVVGLSALPTGSLASTLPAYPPYLIFVANGGQGSVSTIVPGAGGSLSERVKPASDYGAANEAIAPNGHYLYVSNSA